MQVTIIPNSENDGNASTASNQFNTMKEDTSTSFNYAQKPEADDNVVEEECSVERIENIKKILFEIYEEFSPEKLSKIDRLLGKYQGREEEFLRFVHHKYGIKAPSPEDKSPTSITPSEDPGRAMGSRLEVSGKVDNNFVANVSRSLSQDSSSEERARIQFKDSIDQRNGSSDLNLEDSNKEGNHDSPRRLSVPVTVSNVPLRQQNKPSPSARFARSLSPPPAQKRTSNWKTSVDEDIAYRLEVLSSHLPLETDDWMAYEMKNLTEFTRIFPPQKKSCDVEVLDAEDENDGDDDDDMTPTPTASMAGMGAAGQSKTAKNSTSSSSQVSTRNTTAASYEDILYQVFLQDKKQILRLHNPLPNRSIASKDNESTSSSLPPLDYTSRPQIGSIAAQVGKGIGWRAPPNKQPEKKDLTKVLTQTQLDSAKRLSQGLSVSLTHHPSNNSYTNTGMPRQQKFAGVVPAVVVLDQEGLGIGEAYTYAHLQAQTQEAHAQAQAYNQQMQSYMHAEAQQMNSSGERSWPRRATRRMEENRIARTRIEAAKTALASAPAVSAAVLRQQVFAFDENRGGPFLPIPSSIFPLNVGIGTPGDLSIGGGGYNSFFNSQTQNMGNKLHPGLVRYPVQSVGKAVSTSHEGGGGYGNREGGLRDNPNIDSTAVASGNVTQKFNQTPQIPQPPQGGYNQFTQNHGSQINGNYIQNQQSQNQQGGGHRTGQSSQKQSGVGGEAKQGLPQGWF